LRKKNERSLEKKESLLGERTLRGERDVIFQDRKRKIKKRPHQKKGGRKRRTGLKRKKRIVIELSTRRRRVHRIKTGS